MSLLTNESAYVYGQYTEAENKNYHIIRSKDNGKNCTRLEKHTICSDEITFDKLENRICVTSNEMREKGFKLGRKMCGTCISHLYADLSDEELKQLGEK